AASPAPSARPAAERAPPLRPWPGPAARPNDVVVALTSLQRRSNYLLALVGLLKERPPAVMTGFRSQDSRRTFVAQGSGLTRGDRNRNRKLAGLREAVRRDCAVLAVDLGEDKQVAVVMDHECRVLARKVVRARAHELGGLVAWAAERARRAGF